MNKLSIVILITAILATSAAAQDFDDVSDLDRVPDRVVITVKDGVSMSLDKSGSVPRVGVASLDGLAQRFLVERISADRWRVSDPVFATWLRRLGR